MWWCGGVEMWWRGGVVVWRSGGVAGQWGVDLVLARSLQRITDEATDQRVGSVERHKLQALQDEVHRVCAGRADSLHKVDLALGTVCTDEA